MPSTPTEHTLRAAPYDTHPPGRTVFLGARKPTAIRVYADPSIEVETRNAALDFFGHGDHDVELDGDEAYRCDGCRGRRG